MLTSMTGFGRGSASEHSTEATVEIRSVNSRYCEISVRGPRAVSSLEQDVQNLIKQRLERGRITVQIEIVDASDAPSRLSLNTAAAQSYRAVLDRLRTEVGIDDPIRLEHFLQFSDLFSSEGIDEEAEERRSRLVMQALTEGIDAIVSMRQAEGAALRRELEHRVSLIEDSLAQVEAHAPARLAQARNRLRERVAEIIGDERVDPERLELEIVLLADKLDVTEEGVRLRSHIELFRDALSSDESVGRKLNFISQEMNREVNTIGSKANDPDIARYVVTMKEELEKIREQIQNVE
jgi:uncharacterized protein (TIGR00255 family)